MGAIIFFAALGFVYSAALWRAVWPAACDCRDFLEGSTYIELPDEWYDEQVNVLHCTCGRAYVSRREYQLAEERWAKDLTSTGRKPLR
ncbi:MAG: hypothetical protein H7039_02395 [Bryobacteraceae bacterium]|nr:hypothetical protein [Bryobacteraceae bacterium]